MPKLNWNRFIIGGLVAAIILFLTDGFFHESVVGADWNSVYAAIGAREPTESAGSMVYFAIFELGRGFIAMFLYTLMREPFKPGPKTAALAGIVAWLAFSVTGPAAVHSFRVLLACALGESWGLSVSHFHCRHYRRRGDLQGQVKRRGHGVEFN